MERLWRPVIGQKYYAITPALNVVEWVYNGTEYENDLYLELKLFRYWSDAQNRVNYLETQK